MIECFPSVGIANENLDSEEAKILNKILYAEKISVRMQCNVGWAYFVIT